MTRHVFQHVIRSFTLPAAGWLGFYVVAQPHIGPHGDYQIAVADGDFCSIRG
jgi:hypothetical protein